MLYVYFYTYDHLRDLHSFPTRRSSDLDHAVTSVMKNRLFTRFSSTSRRRTSTRGDHPCADAARPATRHCGVLDRKSTRLNSSHVAISYAVFCLKKKTEKRARHLE